MTIHATVFEPCPFCGAHPDSKPTPGRMQGLYPIKHLDGCYLGMHYWGGEQSLLSDDAEFWNRRASRPIPAPKGDTVEISREDARLCANALDQYARQHYDREYADICREALKRLEVAQGKEALSEKVCEPELDECVSCGKTFDEHPHDLCGGYDDERK